MEDITSNSFPIIYGDLAGYRIVDRIQMSVLVDPYTRARPARGGPAKCRFW